MKQENVWDYPRPPRLEPVTELIRISFAGRIIAETDRAMRVLETSHPPVYYLPHEAFSCSVLPSTRRSVCEWKGLASYWSFEEGGCVAYDCAWSYPHPTERFLALRDLLAVYPAAMDACTVDGERVMPQPGGFYGGWITDNLIGPFKGAPGTMGW